MTLLAVLLVLAAGAAIAAGQPPGAGTEPELPKVVLLGDSIRLGYAARVAERLQGRATVISPDENGGDSANLLAHLAEWVRRESPAVVHFNAGLHDLKQHPATKTHQVEPAAYQANLRAIVAQLRKEPATALVFANTTPVDDARHARRRAGFDRFEADVARYNAAAQPVMAEAGVPVHDLHGLVAAVGPARLLGPDGTHFTDEGCALLGDAVADCILRQLAVRRPPSLGTPARGAAAAAAYRAEEARRDAQVPAAYRNLPIGDFTPPADAAAWRVDRPAVRRRVLASLGDLPPRPAPPKARLVSREFRRGYTLERVALDNGVDGEVSALLLIPDAGAGRPGSGPGAPAPAVLWLHSSTPDKNQVITPNTEGGSEPLGEVLARAGYVVLAPDAYWHGDRAGTGPAGPSESRADEQLSLFKLNQWLGRTLWGMFVRDDQVALDYLCSRPEVDPRRIGATGMSMGSTRAWWLAAVDDRVAAVVGIACLTRYQNLIAHGQLRQHGVYYFVDGLLKYFDSEGVLALIAPRAFLALTGELDAGSPADGIRVIEQQVGKVYAAVGAPERFRSILYPEVGHTVTPEMRAEMLAWFHRWLQLPGRVP
jgi:lysophospholipase L1-like esterase